MIPQEVTDSEPLRLSIAAALAFPDGSMKVSGLRRERDAGRLVVEKIAGKEYTTLSNIKDMRRRCQVVKDRDSSSDQPEPTAKRHGSSSTPSTVDMKKAQDAALEITRALSKPSKAISLAST